MQAVRHLTIGVATTYAYQDIKLTSLSLTQISVLLAQKVRWLKSGEPNFDTRLAGRTGGGSIE
jgi:hypothetical protein